MELTIDQAFQQAIEAHKAGQVQEADRLYTAILKAQPKHPDANHNMGVLAVGVGKVEQALPFLKTALETNPDTAQFWLSYIDALIKLERLADAKAVFDQAKSKGAKGDGFDQLEKRLKVLAGGPTQDNVVSETLELRQTSTLHTATQLREAGEFDQAIDLLKEEINRFPEDADMLALLSHCLLLEHQLDAAKLYLDKATKIAPNSASVGWNITRLKLNEKKLLEALNVARDTSQRFPDDGEGLGVLGACLRVNGEIDEGLDVLNKAIELNPNYAEAFINRGLIHLTKENKFEALADLEKAYELKPHIKQIWDLVISLTIEFGQFDQGISLLTNMTKADPTNEKNFTSMAFCHKCLGNKEEAIEAYNKALTIKPDSAEVYNNMGITLQEQGKLEEAIEAFNKALAIEPDYAGAHRNLSTLIKYKPKNPQINKVDELMRRLDLKDADRCHLHYTFAKMNEDLEHLETAYENYVAGGMLRQKLLVYNQVQDQRLFASIKDTTPKLKDFDFNIPRNATAHTPIFILGMPRSGTTLVEQIISCHSKVQGAGELPFLGRFGDPITTGLKVITTSSLSDFRKAYLDKLAKVSGGKQFVTDKMPQNFLNVGLILKALPEAKIIHIKRDSAATCWSNFKHYFASKGLGYSYDLNDTVRYFKLYQDLMNFWDQLYDDRIYHLNYDSLTVEQEPETRKLIEYLDLGWEDACLSPQENKRSVRTASQQQVREKVYTGSSQTWRKFEPYLNGQFDELKA